jgi:F-type H+-transporting ATPase subunit gamma
MKMVSAAKLRRAQMAAEAARAYSDKLTELLRGLATSEAARSHPFMQPGAEAPAHVVLITGDKGLCGAYNANLIRITSAFLASTPGSKASLTTIGRRGRDYFTKRHASVAGQHMNAPTLELARSVANDVSKRFLSGEAGEVYVVYTRFRSAISQVATLERLLPLRDDGEEGLGGTTREYVYEPNAPAILASLLPRYVETRFYHAMLESAASEHGARMTAMDSATRNASEMIDRLTLEMNRARQAGITKELMEIVGGAEALKG